MPSNAVIPGFYGKLPSRGDFVCRNLPKTFIAPWDQWLQKAIGQSRAALADHWLDCYLTSPLWHFLLAPGLCGKSAMAGVIMPSVDRVGRYFPLAIATSLPASKAFFEQLSSAQAWYLQCSELVLTALEDQLDVDNFTLQVASLGQPPPPNPKAKPIFMKKGAAWQYALGDLNRLAEMRPLLLDNRPQRFAKPLSLWTTQGSKQIEPCLLSCRGLPKPELFTAMLDGRWAMHGWEEWELG